MANTIDERLLAGSGADKRRQEEMGYGDRLRQEQLAAQFESDLYDSIV